MQVLQNNIDKMNYVKDKYRLRLFDGSLTEDALTPIGLNTYRKDIRVTFYIILPFILLVGIIAYIIKQPARLIADIKNTSRDILNHLEKQNRGNQ